MLTALIGATLVARALTLPSGRGWIDAYVYLDAARHLLHSSADLYQGVAGVPGRAFIYPPAAAALFVPLLSIASWAGTPAAAFVWICIDAAALWVALLRLRGHLNVRDGSWWWAAVAMAGSLAVLDELWSGQANGAVLLLAVLAWERRTDWSCGVLLGAAMLLKPAVAVVFLVALATGRWRAALWGAATIVAGFVAVIPLVGIARVGQFVTEVLPHTVASASPDANNLSLSAAVHGLPAGLAVTAMHVALWIAVAVGARLGAERWSALVIALATVPVTAQTAWAHYYVYTLGLVMLLIARPERAARTAAWLFLVMALAGVTWFVAPVPHVVLPLATSMLVVWAVVLTVRGRRAIAPAERWALSSGTHRAVDTLP